MGTYTTNYNLFMPSIGEQGWGDLVNGNFTTIDTAMKGLSNNIGTLETEINAVEERVTTLEIIYCYIFKIPKSNFYSPRPLWESW